MSFKMSFARVRKFILVFFISLVFFCGGYFLGVKGYRAEVTKALTVNISRVVPPDKNVDFSLFWQVWDTLTSKYYDKSKLVPSEMVYGAIQGMVSAIGDPYTMYLVPKQNKIVNEDLSGSFSGVGIEIGYRNSNLAVIAPLAGSPAEAAGVKAGDYITHIVDKEKGVDVDSTTMNTNDAVTYIRGKAGTKVSLTLFRDGVDKPIIVELTRAKIDVPSVTLSWVGEASNIADIKISKFGAETKDEWSKAVATIIEKNASKNIIIDLRNNPGGYMQAAIDIASDFVDMGTTIVIQEEGNGVKTEYKSQSLPRLKDYKVVILVNGGSASASEILAGALRDIRGIKIVGDKSFGKGTIQEPIEINGGSGLHVTTAKWLTPGGGWVHEKGITPDTVIANTDTLKEDLQLKAAIKLF